VVESRHGLAREESPVFSTRFGSGATLPLAASVTLDRGRKRLIKKHILGDLGFSRKQSHLLW